MAMSSVRARFDAWFDARGDLRGVCLFRVFAGALAIMHLWPFWRAALRGEYYRDSFYVPWFAAYPEPSLAAYSALLSVAMIAAIALSLGLAARAASWVVCAVVVYHFFLSQTFFHHNRTFLLVFLCGLSLTHSGDSLSLDARLRRHAAPPRPLWPLWLWRALACTPYIASSTSKLLDPDWFGGVVTWDRVERYRHLAAAYVPELLLDLIASPGLHAVLAKLVIGLELAIGVGLWFERTRYAAVWAALWFHGLIQVSARIQVFSLLGIAGLAIWTTPIARERRLELRLDDAAGRRLARWVPRLDWLARFALSHVDSGHAITLREHDGRVFTGRAALWRVLARLPITAAFALPAIGFDLWGEPGRELASTPRSYYDSAV